MNSKFIFGVLISLSVIIIVTTIVTILNPLRGTEAGIREGLLELTPIGIDMENVQKVIGSNPTWEIEWIDNENGYGVDKDGSPGEEIYAQEIGTKSIRCNMGSYNSRIFFPIHVVVYYGFDEETKLIDIAVRKEIDTL